MQQLEVRSGSRSHYTASQMPFTLPSLRRLRRFAVPSLLLLATGSPASAQPFAIGGDPRVDPADFEITVFASDLEAPLPMQMLSDGSLLVGTNAGLLRLSDADDDGVADGPGTLLYTAGSGLVTGLRSVGDLFFMARGQTISVLRSGALPGDPLTLEASFVIELIYPWSHVAHTLAVREIAPGVVELYFNMGSREDAAETTDLISVSGAVTGVLIPDSIYRVVVDDTGPSISLTGLERIASGVRNAFGIDFHPTSGDLYFEDNSMDGETEPFELSADELNVIELADVGGLVEDFGFPDNYFAYRTDVEVGSGGIDPIVTFQPIPPPDGSESEGAVEIAFAPPDFPLGLREGLFVGFHGAFSVAGAANADNPLVYVDLDTGDYFHFIENTEPGVGHPDGLLATADALYVSDLSTIDGVVTNTGRIYKIRSLVFPEPVPALTPSSLWILSLTLFVLWVSEYRQLRRDAV